MKFYAYTITHEYRYKVLAVFDNYLDCARYQAKIRRPGMILATRISTGQRRAFIDSLKILAFKYFNHKPNVGEFFVFQHSPSKYLSV